MICFFKHGVIAAEQFRQLDHIVETLAHFPAINGDHVIVYPITNRSYMIANGALRNFTFMMGKQKIHTAAMNVKLITQIFRAHG